MLATNLYTYQAMLASSLLLKKKRFEYIGPSCFTVQDHAIENSNFFPPYNAVVIHMVRHI